MSNNELCVKDKIVMFDSRLESKQSPLFLYNLSNSGSATCKTEKINIQFTYPHFAKFIIINIFLTDRVKRRSAGHY